MKSQKAHLALAIEKILKRTNPYPHPKHCYSQGYGAYSGRGRFTDEVITAARAYFSWELMHGGVDIDKLEQDPYWHYMEDDDHAA